MQMPLFEPGNTPSSPNLLIKDGSAQYFRGVYSPKSCLDLFKILLETIDWQPDQITMFGNLITTKRKVAWIGDEGCSYTYSGQKKHPQAWTPQLLTIKTKLEELAEWKFNSCLLNLYHNGNEGMGWHSDNEKELNPIAPIASLSLGGERRFAFRHQDDKTPTSLLLENGSVLIMHAPTQDFWKHSLLKTALAVPPRINLTFRDILL